MWQLESAATKASSGSTASRTDIGTGTMWGEAEAVVLDVADTDASRYLLDDDMLVVVPTIEGHRPLLVELQALVAEGGAGSPRRSAQDRLSSRDVNVEAELLLNVFFDTRPDEPSGMVANAAESEQ